MKITRCASKNCEGKVLRMNYSVPADNEKAIVMFDEMMESLNSGTSKRDYEVLEKHIGGEQ